MPVFKGAKHVYLDVGDLVVVAEIDWQHPPAELEAAVLHALRQRLVMLLAGHDWRTLHPHASSARPLVRRGSRSGVESGVSASADVLVAIARPAEARTANRWRAAA